ncbi:MAG: hypothetical protein PXX83_07650 [Candidatus Nitrosotalea sp.]|nr:hypothetical protein [Candidatus Nitrosotalea sp.]
MTVKKDPIIVGTNVRILVNLEFLENSPRSAPLAKRKTTSWNSDKFSIIVQTTYFKNQNFKLTPFVKLLPVMDMVLGLFQTYRNS